MSFAPRIVATAGHIDHGKSTLVEALTGTGSGTDRLPEEKRRGMTIELGFAHLDLPDASADGGGWHIGMVDVPGHADFVRNMVAGVGSIDAALLVVAADDGWMPQTEEHFQILLHLGISHGVVALTKSDLTASLDDVIVGIRSRLADTPWAEAPVVPVSAPRRTGLDALRTALTAVLRQTPPPADIGKPRLFVDRVFTPRGAGTVVTGTLTGGSLRTGDAVFIQPAGLTAKVRGLQNHSHAVDLALPGMRTAIQLAGVEAARDGTGPGVARGHVVEGGSLIPPTGSTVLHVWLERLAREPDKPGTAPVKHGREVWFHHGSEGVRARLYLPERGSLAPGERGLAELRFAEPVAVLAGDRFVLRSISRRRTLAGGFILESAAQARAWKRPRMHESLLTRAAHPRDAAAWVRDLLEREGWLKPAGLLLRSHFSAVEITAAVSSLTAVPRGEWLVARDVWQGALDAAAAEIRRHHETRAHESGLPLAVLRKSLATRFPEGSLTDALVDELTATGAFVREQTGIRSADFKTALSPELRRICLALRGVLYTDKQNPPVLSSFVNTPQERAALNHMVQKGEVFLLTPEIAMLTAGYEELKQRILTYLRSAGRTTMSQIRDATALTRRILVPVCERLDREGFTRRDGDFRRASGKAG